MPRRPTRRQTHKLPDRSPRYSSNITSTTIVEIQTTEATFDQMYEEALSDAFTLRLDELFDGSFDKAFENHFNGVYNKIIRNKFDSIFDKINEKNARMRGGDQGCSSTTGGTGEGGSAGTSPMPLKRLKKNYQPHDIVRRKIRHEISRDIRKEILSRVREAVKKDLEREMRKSITREGFWDILQESKSQHHDQKKDEMARTSLPPKVPKSNPIDDQNPTSGISKLPAATKGKQSKFKNVQTAMARTKKLPGKGQLKKTKDDQNVPSRKAKQLLATRQHSKFLEDLD